MACLEWMCDVACLEWTLRMSGVCAMWRVCVRGGSGGMRLRVVRGVHSLQGPPCVVVEGKCDCVFRVSVCVCMCIESERVLCCVCFPVSKRRCAVCDVPCTLTGVVLSGVRDSLSWILLDLK